VPVFFPQTGVQEHLKKEVVRLERLGELTIENRELERIKKEKEEAWKKIKMLLKQKEELAKRISKLEVKMEREGQRGRWRTWLGTVLHGAVQRGREARWVVKIYRRKEIF
jgi:ABC-type phosphate/phosphonate transport system ATPase subunit